MQRRPFFLISALTLLMVQGCVFYTTGVLFYALDTRVWHDAVELHQVSEAEIRVVKKPASQWFHADEAHVHLP